MSAKNGTKPQYLPKLLFFVVLPLVAMVGKLSGYPLMDQLSLCCRTSQSNSA